MVDGYRISSNNNDMDIAGIHAYLRTSYWAQNIPLATVERALANSLCFGVFAGQAQIGFARMVSDYATFAYLADVYILEAHQSRGLSKWLMQEIIDHPQLQGLRRILLATRDAHGLYQQFGFTELADPTLMIDRKSVV